MNRRFGWSVSWLSVSWLSVSAPLLFGAMDGTVVNRTSNKPEAGVTVTLVKPGQNGMQTIGTTTTDGAGHFAFEKDQPGGGPQLLQADYKGVHYNKLMTPNVPTANVQLEVYEATKSPAVASIAQRMLLIEPSTSQIAVSETVVVENKGTTTYNNDTLGGLRFFLPPAANGQSRVNVQGTARHAVAEGGREDVGSECVPSEFSGEAGADTVRGGRTRCRPVRRSHFVGGWKACRGCSRVTLRLIAPPGVTLAGTDLQKVGTEPKTQATIYTVMAAKDFSADITGTGSLRTGADQAGAVDTSDEPPVTQGLPRVYQHLYWLVGLAFSILAVGLVLLYRASPTHLPTRLPTSK